jgi:NADH-quinone oxidoreductase subunit H
MLNLIITKLIYIIGLTIPIILSVAYLTYAERKIIAAAQLRIGPSLVGPFGLLQPIADAVKLLLKELIIPRFASKKLFILAPIITFVLALIGWAVIPFGVEEVNGKLVPKVIANVNLGLLYLLAISSLEVYGVIIAGWASKSTYAFLGALRSASQMISYEVSIGLIIVTVTLLSGSFNLAEIVIAKHHLPIWVDVLMLPMAFIFFVSILAETNRHPFDLPEAEAELVSGYNVEYSSIPFALFFLGEYANMILTSSIMVILFLGGWYPPIDLSILYYIPGFIWFILKVGFVLFWFIMTRATLPRYRYDQLMTLGWKVFLPISLVWVVIISSLITFGFI